MDIAFSVMHLPSVSKLRDTQVQVLSKQFGATIIYSDPSIPIGVDNHWDTARRAWQNVIDVGSEYCCVLQDDWEVTGELIGLPHRCVSYYRPISDISARFKYPGSDGYRINIGYAWGGTAILPREKAIEFLEFAEGVNSQVEDWRLGMYCKAKNVDVIHYFPPRMKHIGHAESTFGFKPRGE